MAEEGERYRILNIQKECCDKLIQKNKNMSVTGYVTTATGFIMTAMYGYICANSCFHNAELTQILFYGAGSLIFGSASLAQGYKLLRNIIENEKLKTESKKIQAELEQLKENNMEDTMGMGR